jgi:L-alanine-DL-glutamate epimerase-like enolase superfamily enzyme
VLRLGGAGEYIGSAPRVGGGLHRARIHAMKLSIGRRQPGRRPGQAQAVAERIRGRVILVDAHGCYDALRPSQRRRAGGGGVAGGKGPLPPKMWRAMRRCVAAVACPSPTAQTECNRWQFHDKLARRAADVIFARIFVRWGTQRAQNCVGGRPAQHAWCAHVSIGTRGCTGRGADLAAATPNFLLCDTTIRWRPTPRATTC